jgi:TPR repeat protein
MRYAQQHHQVPLLAQGAVLDSLDGRTLSVLGQGLLERGLLPIRAKHLIKAAAYKPTPDPLALYLCGYTDLSACSSFTPAMYIYALERLRMSLGSSPTRVQKIITSTLTTLEHYSHKEAIMLPILQKMASQAGCSLDTATLKNCPYEQSKSWNNLPHAQAACNMLAALIEHYFSQENAVDEPWAVRACYALALLQQAGLRANVPTATSAQYLYFAANRNFEPALLTLITLSQHNAPEPNALFSNQRATFLTSRKHLAQLLKNGVNQDTIEDALDAIRVIIDFVQAYSHYAPYAHIFTKSYALAMQTLYDFTKSMNNYKARCMLATVELDQHNDNAIDKAFELLEPVIYNPQAQHFFAQHVSKEGQEKLVSNAHNNVHASLMLGIILFSHKETQTEAYRYFELGAQKNDFYSLCSAASMIRKNLAQGKTVHDAVIYYTYAYSHAPTTELKSLVLQTLDRMAKDGCLAAQCQYVMALLSTSEQIKKADAIIESIESLPNKEFQNYIMYFKDHCTAQLSSLAEIGVTPAARLLGYIHYIRAQEQPTRYMWHLHSSLGKLHRYNTTERARHLAETIAYTLACHYQQSGNTKNALRLFEIAASYHHRQALCYCALYRLQKKDNPQMNDIQMVEQLASAGLIDAQKCLTQVYYRTLTSAPRHAQTAILAKARHYLEQITAQKECEPSYYILLGKILAHNDDAAKRNKAIELCTRAIQSGLSLTEEESEQFGILACQMHQDQLALQLLESCKHTQQVQLAKALLYLRSHDQKDTCLHKALHALSECLLIEHDILTLDCTLANYIIPILQQLKSALSNDEHATMIFLRLCYAYGLEKNFIPQAEFMQLADKLDPLKSLGSLSFIIFLNRHGVITHQPVFIALESYEKILSREQSDVYKQEIAEQLKLIAEPVLQRNYYNTSQDTMIHAIKATHALVIQECQTSVTNACIHFCLAEEAETTIFPYDDPMAYATHILESVNILTDLASQEKNNEAFIAILLFRGFRILQYRQESQEKIDSWLKISTCFLAQHALYTHDTNPDYETLVSILYLTIGKIKLLLMHDIQQAQSSFKQALEHTPSNNQAQIHLAYTQLLDTQSTMQQKRAAIKLLRAQAQQHDHDACYLLGLLYLQQNSPYLARLHVCHDIQQAHEYFKQAAHSHHHHAVAQLANLKYLRITSQ